MVYEVRVSKDELSVMLIATVRYALGRQSYFPGIAQGLLKKFWGVVSKADRDVILRDMQEYLEKGTRLNGHDCYEHEWRDLFVWLREHDGTESSAC